MIQILNKILKKLKPREMTNKHTFTKGNVTTTIVDLTEGLGQRTPAEILTLTKDGAIREFSERLPDGRIITYSLEVEEEILEEEEEIEINTTRKIGTCTAEHPEGLVDTLTSIVEGEEIIVNKTFSRTISRDELTSTEVIQSSEKEGGSSVSLEWRRNNDKPFDHDDNNSDDERNNDKPCDHDDNNSDDERLKNNTFYSDNGVEITEL